MKNGCRLCMMIYGFEKPECAPVRGSNNFIAILDSSDKMQKIFVIPKKTEITTLRILYDQELAMELADLFEQVMEYIVKELKAPAFSMATWSLKCEVAAPIHMCDLFISIKNPNSLV